MIEGNLVYLRQMEEEDMGCYYDMINDYQMYCKVVGFSFPVSHYEQIEWYRNAIHDKNNKRFTIVLKETNLPVGLVTLSNIDWQNRSATHGIKLHSSCPKGHGIGTDAVMAFMKYVFEELNLNRLDGSWMEDNIASEKLYLKCGWRIEGIKRSAIFRNGKYHNLKISGITQQDYYQHIQNNGKI